MNWQLRERAKSWAVWIILPAFLFLIGGRHALRNLRYGSEATFSRRSDAAGNAIYDIAPARISFSAAFFVPTLTLAGTWLISRVAGDEGEGIFLFLFWLFAIGFGLFVWLPAFRSAKWRRPASIALSPTALVAGDLSIPYRDIAEITIGGAGRADDVIVVTPSMTEQISFRARSRQNSRSYELQLRRSGNSERITLFYGLTAEPAQALAQDLVTEIQLRQQVRPA